MSRPAPVLQPKYAVAVPVAGAERVAIQGIGVEGGMIDTGTGTNIGFLLGASARPWSDDAGGGSFDANLVVAKVPEARSTFLFSKLGFGLIGSTILRRDGDETQTGNTFDLMTPQAEVGVGHGVGKGMSVNVALTGQYLWHVHNDFKPGSEQLLVGIRIGIGLFDPGTDPDDHLLEPLFRSSVSSAAEP